MPEITGVPKLLRKDAKKASSSGEQALKKVLKIKDNLHPFSMAGESDIFSTTMIISATCNIFPANDLQA